MMSTTAPVISGILPAVSMERPQLRPWIEQMADLCQPDEVVWCDGSQEEYDRLCELLVQARHVPPAEPGKAARQLPGPLRPDGRGPGRGPDVRLQPPPGTTPDRPTTGSSPSR